MTLAKNKAMETAKTVVDKYNPTVRYPNFDNLEISFKSAIPTIIDTTINGTAIIFNRLINIYRYWYVDANVAFPKAIPVIPGVFLINSFADKSYFTFISF